MNHEKLSRIRSKAPVTVAVEAIRKDILGYYNVTWNDIIRDDRTPKLVFVRHLLVYILVNKKALIINDAARLLSRDHSTINNAIKSIQNYLDTDSSGKREEILIHLRKHGIGG